MNEELTRKIDILKRLIEIAELNGSSSDYIWGLKSALYILEI